MKPQLDNLHQKKDNSLILLLQDMFLNGQAIGAYSLTFTLTLIKASSSSSLAFHSPLTCIQNSIASLPSTCFPFLARGKRTGIRFSSAQLHSTPPLQSAKIKIWKSQAARKASAAEQISQVRSGQVTGAASSHEYHEVLPWMVSWFRDVCASLCYYFFLVLHEGFGDRFTFFSCSNNILYPKEDRDQKILLYACRNCDHQVPSSSSPLFPARFHLLSPC